MPDARQNAKRRLYPLTKKRAKPAVPLGANYRLIDIPVSNCINSNVTKIYCLTQVLFLYGNIRVEHPDAPNSTAPTPRLTRPYLPPSPPPASSRRAQFNSASLNRHLSQAYNSNVGGYNKQGFVEVLAAQQSPENPDW